MQHAYTWLLPVVRMKSGFQNYHELTLAKHKHKPTNFAQGAMVKGTVALAQYAAACCLRHRKQMQVNSSLKTGLHRDRDRDRYSLVCSSQHKCESVNRIILRLLCVNQGVAQSYSSLVQGVNRASTTYTAQLCSTVERRVRSHSAVQLTHEYCSSGRYVNDIVYKKRNPSDNNNYTTPWCTRYVQQ